MNKLRNYNRVVALVFVAVMLLIGGCKDEPTGVTTPDGLKPSAIRDYDKFYKPVEFATMDMFSEKAQWSFYRHKQSEHFIVFWEAGFGKDPSSKSISESMRVNIDDLLAKAEVFYQRNIETLKFAETGKGKSYLDQYKMQIYLFYQDEWLATGAGYDDVIGALWVNPSTCKPVGSTIAHEIGHSFQYQVYCDKLHNGAVNDFHQGFRYGFGPNGEGGNGFWEQCAQWQSLQDYPEELFGYHVDVWKANYHRHFNHEWMRYASYWLPYYWVQKHGTSVVGDVWKQSVFPEDPLITYQRLYCDGNIATLYEELYDYAARMVTYDIDVIRKYATESAKSYSTKLYNNDGYYQVGYSSCPGSTGFNVISLDVPASGNTVKADFVGLTSGGSLAPNDLGNIVDANGKKVGIATVYNANNVSSGWRYGFVAVVNGVAQYAPMNQGRKNVVTYIVPAGIEKLFFVVMGAPDQYTSHFWNENETDDIQCPYKVKFEGAEVSNN